MGACASQLLPTAVVVDDKLPESSINSSYTVNMLNLNNPDIVKILHRLIEEYCVTNNGCKKSYLCLYALGTRLRKHFGSECVNSMVDVVALRRMFEASGWTFVPPKSNEYFTITFSKATCAAS